MGSLALPFGILKEGSLGLAPVDDLTCAKAVGGFAGLDLVEEEDAVGAATYQFLLPLIMPIMVGVVTQFHT